ncbi:ElyC/SanA/YdcF family protein [Candidatus Kapabacteria bacterium]|nr:ElyC/SanA/YdcF family protein [Candidatus Kapabacteria bacterium]
MIVFVMLCNEGVNYNANGKVYSSPNNTPKRKTALLLGTSKFLSWQKENLYYKFRIDAAIDLWNNQKIDFFLISGDNSNVNYNEPQMMKDDLVSLGVPPNRIYLDYAGFRTFDSVIRSKDIFGQDSLIIISQKFHIQRAIYLAENYNMNAIGFVAKSPIDQTSFLNYREIAARTKMILDIYLLGTKPKFDGDKIKISAESPQF